MPPSPCPLCGTDAAQANPAHSLHPVSPRPPEFPLASRLWPAIAPVWELQQSRPDYEDLLSPVARGWNDRAKPSGPMLNVARACQVCHRYPEQEIQSRVTAIQDRNRALMIRAEDAVLALLDAVKAA